jgi:NTP pyrophosphatase (non-canonical NTP hydrolase)
MNHTVEEIVKKHYEWVEEMGWHNKTPLEYVALIAEEVGELARDVRLDKPVDEELADIALRVADLAMVLGVNLGEAIAVKMTINRIRGTRGRKK